jgi:thiamine-phosphate pyrophosphorylase
MKEFFKLPRVYPITDTQLSGLTHVEQITMLVDGGATLMQVREKKASSLEFYEAAREACAIASVSLIINDRADIALTVRAAGVHLGQDDLPPEAARRLLGDDAIIGYSTHSLAQLAEAAKLPVDYIAFGPVFQTGTKSDSARVVGLEGVRAARNATDKPLVAIGGITLEKARDVIDAGADSVAMISGLLTGPGDISSRLRDLLVALTAGVVKGRKGKL